MIIDSLEATKHRGPDNSLITDGKRFYGTPFSNLDTINKIGLCKDEKSTVWLGFNRLSIVDSSEAAMQPFYDEESECYFMLNGEIYNYKKLREEHLQEEEFFSNSDSEVAFKMYLKYGDKFVDFLQGMFAIVVYDKKKVKVWRDRLGIKPFYYFKNENSFVFSSEIKGVLATQLVKKATNFKGLAYSMYLGTCPAPLTIYEDIFSLQAGHFLEFHIADNSIKISPYWHLEYLPQKKKIEFPEFAEDVQHLCQLYSTGEVEKAIMLSGGIDSGTLAYFYSKVDLRYKALTIYQKNSENNELEFAIDNAKNAGLELLAFQVPEMPTSDEEKVFLLAEEEPNYAPEPALFLSQKASEKGYKVLYNALGPDEIFGGYPYFQRINKIKNISFLLKFIPDFLLKNNLKLKDLKTFGLHNFALISRSVFSWKEIILFLEKNNQPVPEHPIRFLNHQINDIYPDFSQLPLLKKVSYLDVFYYIASHHTVRCDVPSMKYSIEMRFPFLEHTFIEKYFNQENVFDNLENELKPMMMGFAKNILSKKVINMPKKGFSIDVKQWNSKENAKKEWYLKSLKGMMGDIQL